LNKTLTTDLLRHAYSIGYFPMPDPDTEEILWYCPDPRAIIPLEGFHVSRSLRRSIRNRGYTTSIDRAFKQVMIGCANRKDSWINAEFHRVYQQLHLEGDAHSIEVWTGEKLVGGVYGVALGGAFFAESKFHIEKDASKVALFYLIEHMRLRGMVLLEVQFLTAHLQTLGACTISASDYQDHLTEALTTTATFL
jgi:leucyl/phenylalanyl-tRNA--protein transferase